MTHNGIVNDKRQLRRLARTGEGRVVTSTSTQVSSGTSRNEPKDSPKGKHKQVDGPSKAKGTGEVSIGELAELAMVSTRTIRYYEELGILPSPQRTPGGTRRYPREYIFYVEGAKILKGLGFGLEEIAELGKFALTGTSASKRTQAILQEKLAELDHQIRVLHRLQKLVANAAANHKTSGSAVPELLRWISRENGFDKVEGN
jgi:DNA-binding transcriptional MerR regulator